MSVQAKELLEKYDLFGCMQCGKCTAGCPVSSNSRLNIRRLIRELTVSLEAVTSQEEELWNCTTCSTCTLRCPRGLEPHELIIGLRGALIEKGSIPVTARDALEDVFKHGNPWGRIRTKRDEWAEGLGIKDMSKGDKADILYYVCCAASYDPRVQEVSRALVKVLSSAGVDFGILGNEENCCGSEVRRMGEEGLFEMMVEDNIKLFDKYQITRMITTSPHCYDVMKNKYNGRQFEVIHYTQFLSNLINEGKLTFTKNLDKVVTYHDPCYLGKQNNVYDEPRHVLQSLPGVKYMDFDRCRERSLCCEGGGGRMWLEGTITGERLSHSRINSAVEMGVDIIATACPFCLMTLEDAAKTSGFGDKIIVKDINELLIEAI